MHPLHDYVAKQLAEKLKAKWDELATGKYDWAHLAMPRPYCRRNSLGEGFLLDVAWLALTRRWPHDLNARLTSGYRARPTDVKKPATIAFGLKSEVDARGLREPLRAT